MPPDKVPLGKVYVFTFLAPLVLAALVLSVVRGNKAGEPISLLLVGSIGCSVACGIMISKAMTRSVGARVGVALVSFVFLQIFYLFALVGGCSAVSGPMNTH